MIQKILVPIHRGDAIGRHVFLEAVDLAKATGASLKLLHVLAVDEEDSPTFFNLLNTPENRKRWEEFERPGLELLRSLSADAIQAGVPTDYTQTLGRPSHVICDIARVWGADLIMMGRRGLSGMSELLMGSVSNYVSHYAPCSVMVVQGPVHSQPKTQQKPQVASSPA
ncbi:MAG: universal stress protein [Synechococcales cyanobacterium C42_A2020_086]|nr:universal stress protein [Synechococcales cyanobacterium M58_A2018_015]MBF2073293.1 universal stress protein [Synechococcales cyanobacterium C42_A2020_086]